MLETPPHAAFLNTPGLPTHNPGQTILPDTNVARRHQAQAQQTPLVNGNADDGGPSGSQASHNALAPATSEIGHADEQSYLESAHQDAEDTKQLRDCEIFPHWRRGLCLLQSLVVLWRS